MISKITAKTSALKKALEEAGYFMQIVSSMDEIQKRDGWGEAKNIVKQKFPDLQLIAGNIATGEAETRMVNKNK